MPALPRCITPILSALAVTLAPPPAARGADQVLAVTPPAWVERQGARAPVLPGLVVEPGDLLETGPRGELVVTVEGGPSRRLGGERRQRVSAQWQPAAAAPGRVLLVASGPWTVSLGSLPNRSAAVSALRRLHHDGYPVQISEVTVGGAPRFRLVIRGLRDQGAARRLAARLEERGDVRGAWAYSETRRPGTQRRRALNLSLPAPLLGTQPRAREHDRDPTCTRRRTDTERPRGRDPACRTPSP